MSALVATALLASATGHGMLTRPVSRALRNALAEAHQDVGVSGGPNEVAKDGYAAAGGCLGHACEWYTQWTIVPANMSATNCDPKFRTMGVSCENKAPGITDWPCTHGLMVPWCAPGYAPVKSSCGLFAGGYNQKAVDMSTLDGTPVAVWRAGGEANVSWAVTANHGGGYAYRLCRHGDEQNETCFARIHLNFTSKEQYIMSDNGTLMATVPAQVLSTGTWPPNSQWMRNPFPQEFELMPNNSQIRNLPNAFGRGPFAYNTIDTVQVPEWLEPGNYTLSFRWDAEQTKQVWQQCSDVMIVPADTNPLPALPTPPPLSTGRACTGVSVGLATADCEAWLDMYDSLDGPNWPANWSQDCASVRTDPCGCKRTWQKNIVCDFTRDFGHIAEMYLLGGAPKGRLPRSLANLTHLRALSLVMTNIEGSLPENLGDMKDLSMIWLDHNTKLGGQVPQSMATLANVSVLELHHSNFNGKLPTGIDYSKIPDCTLNGLVFDCPLPKGAETCGAVCLRK